jgi:hypothetical protein
MKTITALIFVSIMLFSSFVAKDYSFIKEFKVSSPVDLVISTSGGDINATGYEKDVIEVAFVIRKNGQVIDITLEELKKLAEVEIIESNNNIQIRVKKMIESNISIGFEVKTPYKTSCNFHTSGGDIETSDVVGNHEFKTSGGDLSFKNISGKLLANTSGGDISINNSKADIISRTSGGDVSMENIEGKVETHTSGGDIKISNSKYDVIAETSGGDIDLSAVQGIIGLKTSGGDISLANISGSVNAKTSGGKITADILKLNEKLILKTSGGSIIATVPSGFGLDLQMTGNKVNTLLTNFSGKAAKGEVIGQINGGGILVELSTTGGNVTLNYR